MKLNIPNGTVRLDDVYLHKFKHVKKVSLPQTLRELPLGAFYQCTELKKVFFDPEIKLTKFPEKCFQGCHKLEHFSIPKSIVSIEKDAFKDVTSIEEFEIPETVTFIDEHAFDGWKENQIIYVFQEGIILSKACQAELVVLKEEEGIEYSVSDKHYIVVAKGGHVGRQYYMPMYLPIRASSKKQASDKARIFPRVKKDQKDVILDVYPVSEKAFYQQVEDNDKDPYYQVHSKHEQNEYFELIKDRLVKDPYYVETKNKRKPKR